MAFFTFYTVKIFRLITKSAIVFVDAHGFELSSSNLYEFLRFSTKMSAQKIDRQKIPLCQRCQKSRTPCTFRNRHAFNSVPNTQNFISFQKSYAQRPYQLQLANLQLIMYSICLFRYAHSYLTKTNRLRRKASGSEMRPSTY